MHLVWFRRDLRLTDNPALTRAIENSREDGKPVAAVFVKSFTQWQEHHISDAQLNFMHRNLQCLERGLERLGIALHVVTADQFGETAAALKDFCDQHGVARLYANSEYEINERERDREVTEALESLEIEFKRFHEQCIVAPAKVKTGSDEFYKVYSPFYKSWQALLDEAPPEVIKAPEPTDLNQEAQDQAIKATGSINDPQWPTVSYRIIKAYPAGEDAAYALLDQFIDEPIDHYSAERNFPALAATSNLSAYLTLGVISAKACYVAAHARATDGRLSSAHQKGAKTWVKELAWRDFYRHVLVGFPRVGKDHAFNEESDKKVSWRYDEEQFEQWKAGKTGVPLVDAAMRCLRETAFMHNRLRMVVAMYLTKDLFIDWRWGEAYFMTQLIDGDFASNSGGWQWSASVGTDAAPYFRIMNPYTQGERFDSEAKFIKQWVPELKDAEPKVLFKEDKLAKCAKHFGYVAPLVDHKQAREEAIAQFKNGS